MFAVQLLYLHLCLYLLCLMHSYNAIGINTIRFRKSLEKFQRQQDEKIVKQNLKNYLQHKYQHIGQLPETYLGEPYPDLYLNQPLDHFDPQLQFSYRQRYWVNKDHWKAQDGPVFLFIGGEGGLSSAVVQKGEHYDLAVKYGALIFAVEHRYYGKSINKDGLQLENMQYLSSQQALADLATFHSFATNKFNLTASNTWISFGGSYPGALSAWFRIKYPHLVYGAIASSAPVHAKVNFEGYNEVVADSLADPVVNGSSKCVLSIHQAFKQVDLMLCDKQYTQLSTDFTSCAAIESDKDIYQFASNLADIFMSTVQYNAEVPGLNITTLCNKMTDKNQSPYNNLKDLNKLYLNTTEQVCADNKWSSFIKMMQNTSSAEAGVGFRQWIYQTCTQFGYYQTCEPNTTCIFSNHMTLKMNLEICREVFNINSEEVFKRVEFTNSYYGGGHPSGTRIVFVNGSIDPWHALSILKNITSTETAIYIDGTAHCANMRSDESSDPPSLIKAREAIDYQIGNWLKMTNGFKQQDTNLYFKP